ncbi:MAG: cation:proton antiporter [Pseudomonadota bacterium]|nr:cation:proton antiporter [Pseudomonadota bacterium]
METLFSSIEYKDPAWIAIAFIFGFLSKQAGLPPLVGFLVAGFTLNYLGAESGSFLEEMADLGITLLLFSIGLKLRIKELLRVEVWGVTLIHMLIVSTFMTISLLLAGAAGLPLLNELDLASAMMIGFALSFSSTVFVVKMLEGRGDMLSHYGRLAVGVLIVQDIVAVFFIGVSEAKVPSIWAAGVIVLMIIGRSLLYKLFSLVGRGELLVLFGLVLAIGGAVLFDAVDMKGDLGALVFGVLLANHPKSTELAKSLFSIKELFLVGFFLNIGMAGLPNVTIIGIVVILLVVLLMKMGLFFLLFSRFRVRTRSANSTSFLLGNYSEFGLIVSVVAVSQQWISQEWLVIMAVLVASSFAISSAVNNFADNFYSRYRNRLGKFEHSKRLPGDEDIDLSDVRYLICGMGRVGSGAFDYLLEQGHKNLLGLDFDADVVASQNAIGRKTHFANVSSPEFWSRLDARGNKIEWVMLCVPNSITNEKIARLARQWGYKGLICATTKYPDEEARLIEAGADAVFNIYAEAGAGLAQNVQQICNITAKH